MRSARKIPPAKGTKSSWRDTLSGELRKAECLFVMGIGNSRKGDDAVGCLFVRLLKREMARVKRCADARSAGSARPQEAKREAPPLEFQILSAGETPEALTGLIREFRPTHVLIVDAAVAGRRPGTIFIVPGKKISQEDVSTHRLPLSLLARYLEESIGCRVILVGIEPKEIAWGKPVSAAVRAAAARVSAWLAEILIGRSP